MSDAPVADAPKKKGGMIKKLVLFVIAPLALIGAGVGGGMYAAGKGAKGAAAEDPNQPHLLLKGEGKKGTEEKGGEKSSEPVHVDPGRYQATYYPIEQPFTSNLHDTDGFLQLGLGVSTFYDQRVVDNLKHADMPVRSAVLEVLSQQSAEVLNTPEGKAKLRAELKDAVNQVLKEHEGFGGVDGVYFTSFIIQ